jgi:hypothetical protein
MKTAVSIPKEETWGTTIGDGATAAATGYKPSEERGEEASY